MTKARSDGFSGLQGYKAPDEILLGAVPLNYYITATLVGVVFYSGHFISAYLSGETQTATTDIVVALIAIVVSLQLAFTRWIGSNIRKGTAEIAADVVGGHDWLRANVLARIFAVKVRAAAGVCVAPLGVIFVLRLGYWYHSPAVLLVDMIGIVVAGFIIGSGVVGAALVGIATYKLGSSQNLRVNIWNPGRVKICASWGLQISLLGSVLLALALIAIVSAPLSISPTVRYAPAFSILIAGAGVLVIAFYAPLYSLHRSMASEKNLLLEQIDTEYEQRCRELIRASSSADRDSDGRAKVTGSLLSILDNLDKLKDKVLKAKEWPYDMAIFRKFAATILIPWVTFAVQRYFPLFERWISP